MRNDLNANACGANDRVDKNKNMEKTIVLGNGKYLYMVDYNRIINAKIKNVFLAHARKRTLAINEIKMNENILRKKVRELSMVTLEVTQKCNLRCRYCVFNDNYENYRPFTANEMPWETAKKGIDYIYSLVQNKKEKKFIIGFYGGEPLLNKTIVKKVVGYGTEKFKGWDLSFKMTTNLTTLDADILGFLIKNDVHLTISLDGDKSNHDAKRVFPNGGGTHEAVMKNLRSIKDANHEYYRKNIAFAAVHSLDLPLENMTHFFETDELASEKSFKFANVNQFKTDYYDRYPWDRDTKVAEFNRLEEGIVQKLRNQEQLSRLEMFFNNTILLAAEFQKYRSHTTVAQTCIFDSRLLLDAEGNIHICEKINNAFAIGHIDSGLDFGKMLKILRDFSKLVKQECSECDLRFMCSRCFAFFAANGTFKIPPDFCGSQRKALISNLETYIQYKEEGLIK